MVMAITHILQGDSAITHEIRGMAFTNKTEKIAMSHETRGHDYYK